MEKMIEFITYGVLGAYNSPTTSYSSCARHCANHPTRIICIVLFKVHRNLLTWELLYFYFSCEN